MLVSFRDLIINYGTKLSKISSVQINYIFAEAGGRTGTNNCETPANYDIVILV